MSDPRFESELKKRILEEIERIRDILETASGVDDFAQYKFLAGQLFAYKRMTENYFDEVNTKLNEAR